MGFIPGMQTWVNARKLINEIYHINKLRGGESHDHINAEKCVTKINTHL